MGALQFTATSNAVAVAAAASPTAVAMPAFASNAQQVRISNPGSNPVHVAFGDSGVVASATSPYVVLPGESAIFTIAKATHVSAFAATGTPTIYLVLGYGE